MIFIINFKQLGTKLMNNIKYSLYLNEVRKYLAAKIDRSPFHPRLAFLPGWLIQGCSSVSNPFTGGKILRIFPFIRFTHSYGYASAGDQPILFARFSLIFVPFVQYMG